MTTTQTTETPLPEEIEATLARLCTEAICYGGAGEPASHARRQFYLARAEHVTAIRKALPQPSPADGAVRRALEGILRFCNRDGSPCDGFRFRELVLEAGALLTSTSAPVLEPEHEGTEVVGEGSCPNCEGTGPCDDCREEEPPPAPEDRQEAAGEACDHLLIVEHENRCSDCGTLMVQVGPHHWVPDTRSVAPVARPTELRARLARALSSLASMRAWHATYHGDRDPCVLCVDADGCLDREGVNWRTPSPSSTGSQEGGERQALELVLSHHAEECDCDGEERDADGAPYQCVYCIGRLALDPAAVCVRCSTPIRDASPGCTNPHHARRARGGGR